MPNSLTSFFSAKNLALYGTLSVAAAAAVVFNAFRERSNFYAATVMLSRSNGSMLILLNLGFFFAVVSSRISQLVFFGALRPVEVEHIYERCSFSIGESLIALTIFRDQFDVGFFAIFVELLFAKIFHWLCSDRVEYMEQSPSVSRLFHIRMCSLLWFLFVIDVVCVIFVVEYVAVQRERSGLVLLFASEYIILFANLLGTIAKYGISWYDLRREEPWEAKSMYIFYVDLVIDGIKFVTYAAFFSLILSYYGFPINMLQNLYLTGRQFVHRLRDLVRYRAATRNMNERYPDATHADMRTCDGVCIICRDEMRVDAVDPDAEPVQGADGQAVPPPPPQPSHQRVVNETPKKLPCGHIFHFQCLRSWLERQQSCPTCRRTVLPTDAATATAQAPAQPAPAQAPAAGPGPANPTPDAAAPAQPRAPPNPEAFPGAAARQERLLSPSRQPIPSTPRAAPRNEDVAPSAKTTESSPQAQLLAFLESLETRLHSEPGPSNSPRPPLPEEIVHAILADARDTARDQQRSELSSSQEESKWVLPHPDELKRTSSLAVFPADASSVPTTSPAPMAPTSSTPLSPREAARAAAIKRAEMLMGKKKGSDSKQDSLVSHHATPSSVNSDPKLARVLGGVTLTRHQQAADRAEAPKSTHLVPLFEVDGSPEWATEKASLPYPIIAAERSSAPSTVRSRGVLRELGPQDQQVLDNSLAALAAAREEMRKAQVGIDAILDTLSLRGTIVTSQDGGKASSDHRSELGAGEAIAGAAIDKGKRPTEGIHAPAPDLHPYDDVS